jgi:hypothetical protein
MRESRPYGSVRGARGNSRPYRYAVASLARDRKRVLSDLESVATASGLARHGQAVTIPAIFFRLLISSQVLAA